MNRSAESDRRPGVARRLAGIAFAVVLCLVCLEVGARVAIRAMYGGVTVKDVRDRRAEVVAGVNTGAPPVVTGEAVPQVAADGVNADQAERPEWVENEVLHPYLGYVRRPRKELYYPVSDYGFEDPNSPIHPARAGQTVVGIIGGSFAMQFGQASRDALRRALQESPRFQHTQILFVNAALGGFKEPQQVMTLNYLLAAGGHFDVIIHIDGFNEVALHRSGNELQGVSLLYPRSWYFRVEDLPDKQLRSLEGRVTYLEEVRVRLARGFSSPVINWFGFGNLTWRLLDDRLDIGIHEALVDIEQYAPAETAPNLLGPPDAFPDDDAEFEQMAELWERSSLQLNALCEGMGIEYFHFLQPNQYDPGAKVLNEEERRLAYSEKSRFRPDVERGYPLLREKGVELKAEGVRFYDFSRVFAEDRETLFWDACCHLNQEGYDLFAARAGEVIVAALDAKQD